MGAREKDYLLHRPTERQNYVLVIHGGAGTMTKEGSTPEQQAAYHTALREALRAGYEVLHQGGEAMDAVVEAVAVMEDNPLFNAAKGAVFNVAGKNELETSLMLSKPPSTHPSIPTSRRGIGITLLTRARNPSRLARALYLAPSLAPHAFLSGPTAEALGESLGETLVDPSYFFTERRWKEHRKGLGLPSEPLPQTPEDSHLPSNLNFGDDRDAPFLDQLPTGTVGAVALDVRGCIAVLTSTGGRTNKLVGRIGDTPSMAAGFWAEEWKLCQHSNRKRWIGKWWRRLCRRPTKKAVGVSGTGDGDYFVRQATAATIGHRMKFGHQSLQRAAEEAVEDLRADGGVGGVIALDLQGNVAMPLNCPGMYRGVIHKDGIPRTAIFHDDVLS